MVYIAPKRLQLLQWAPRRLMMHWKLRKQSCLATIYRRLGSEQTTSKTLSARGRHFGAFTTRGEGVTQATFRFPEIVSAIHLLASFQPSGFTTEPYMSAQLNDSSSLPIHKDKNHFSRSWLIGLGSLLHHLLHLLLPVLLMSLLLMVSLQKALPVLLLHLLYNSLLLL